MDVKDIFALRKQGKIEEAYEALKRLFPRIERGLIEHRGSKKTGGYHALDSTSGRLLP